jgi:hypothetical protein
MPWGFGLSSGRIPRPPKPSSIPTARAHKTDAQEDKRANVQIAVDESEQIIVSAAVTQSASDAQQLESFVAFGREQEGSPSPR